MVVAHSDFRVAAARRLATEVLASLKEAFVALPDYSFYAAEHETS